MFAISVLIICWLASSIKSAFKTCTKNGYEIHSEKIDGVERYWHHKTPEDFDAYGNRLEKGIGSRFDGLVDFEERTKKILEEQNADEPELTVGAETTQ